MRKKAGEDIQRIIVFHIMLPLLTTLQKGNLFTPLILVMYSCHL